MFKYLNKNPCHKIMLGAFFPFSHDADKVEIGSAVSKEKVPSKGWQRLQKMFRVDEFGEVSDEVTIITQTAMLSSFVGLVYGGFINSRTAYMDFMRQNTASSFTSHFEAKRKLQDTVTKNFAKGAFKWAWRVSLFSTSFVGIATAISVYRGESGIREFVCAGAATGAMYKWQMGPRGWIVGGAFGAVLGVFSGTLTYGLLLLSGKSIDEMRGRQAQMGGFRKDLIKEGLRRREEEEDPVILSLRGKGESKGDSINET